MLFVVYCRSYLIGILKFWPNLRDFWTRFLSLARSKLKLCSANHRPGYWSNLPCDWLSTAWAYSEQETENGPWSCHHLSLQGLWIFCQTVSTTIIILDKFIDMPVTLVYCHKQECVKCLLYSKVFIHEVLVHCGMFCIQLHWCDQVTIWHNRYGLMRITMGDLQRALHIKLKASLMHRSHKL